MFGTVRCLVFSRETDLRNVTWIAFFSETQRCTHFKFCKQAYFKFFYKANGFKNESERVTLSSSPTLKLQEQLNKVREVKTELELQLEKEVDRSKKVKHIFRDNI